MNQHGEDPRRVVRRGYDEAGLAYLNERPDDGDDVAILRTFAASLGNARVLDAGCGAGIPTTSTLVSCGLDVVGLDISLRQLVLATERVPSTELVQGDLVNLPFADRSFDAVVSYYAVIHVPRDHHPDLLAEIHRVLRPAVDVCLCSARGTTTGIMTRRAGSPYRCSGATSAPRRISACSGRRACRAHGAGR